MTEIAIIGGTGLTSLENLEITNREVVHTPYGEPSGVFVHGVLAEQKVVFLARHGHGHTIPPHKINYRANIWAIKHLNVRRIIAVAAVGAINEKIAPGEIAIPDQIIDYTYGRQHTFYEEDDVRHIDFTFPYCKDLRQLMLRAAENAGVEAYDGGVYGATQGPRLETAAEIRRMRQDGCDLVGMTGMPEAALARELDLSYATCAVSANWGAGMFDEEITMQEIQANLENGMAKVRNLLVKLVEMA